MNPHDVIGCTRRVWWNELEVKNPIELEFIDYFRASDYRMSKGRYVIYYALTVSDYPYLGINQGEPILFYISYKSYIIALSRLRSEYLVPCQRKFAEGKNLYIKIEKVNTEKIKIHCQEIREPSEEQLSEAKRQYRLIRQENEHHARRDTSTENTT